jgi:endopeptidase Clp ATP-binding regulatory subunit ClpX
MKTTDEKRPDPEEIEKEITRFLAKKFGGTVRFAAPYSLIQEDQEEKTGKPAKDGIKLNFDLKPEDLISYLDQYITKQDEAKAVLSTKICTHYNRIKTLKSSPEMEGDLFSGIKNNVLMLGPTGVGKTYMIRLIAKKIGVPFVKGDATKFSETGYVGGDVEDLVRDLVREADDNIELARFGIIYIDEIDKIASSHNIIGADVSRTGVQRALLKPLEETDVDLRVPHDPISMMQEIERFRKTGKKNRRIVNTKNILFIVSGAFADLAKIIHKRVVEKGIGFGATIPKTGDYTNALRNVKSEDLVEFGFESEFVGRLPVRAVFEVLNENDLYDILSNPNNPIILSKKLDFAAYGINIKFEKKALRILAKQAFDENIGARGLVSAIERALLIFEKSLPSTNISKFPFTVDAIISPKTYLDNLISQPEKQNNDNYERLLKEEKELITNYLNLNKKVLTQKYSLTLTPSRINLAADFYSRYIVDIGVILQKIKTLQDEIKNFELSFFKSHDINIVIEDDAIDFVLELVVNSSVKPDDFYNQMNIDFEHGLKLAREKTGKNRFFLTRQAFIDPETFISSLIRNSLGVAREETEKA